MSEPPARLTKTGQELLCVVWGLTWAFSILFAMIGWIGLATDARDASWGFALGTTGYAAGASVGAWAGRYLE